MTRSGQAHTTAETGGWEVPLSWAIVRILQAPSLQFVSEAHGKESFSDPAEDGRRRHCGFGLLVDTGRVVTCAHVVARSLGKQDDCDAPSTEARVYLDFPLLAPGSVLTASVEAWVPMAGDGRGDVAGLLIDGYPPAGARPHALVRSGDVSGHDIMIYGYQDDYGYYPTWVPCSAVAPVEGGWLQLGLHELTGGLRIRSGFSGSPVLDQQTGQVIGLTVRSDTAERDPTWQAYAVTGEVIFDSWEQLRESRGRANPFRLLHPFQAGDHDVFFGRDDLAAETVEKITGREHTLVIGASGSGKTSMLNALVVPALEQAGHAVLTLRASSTESFWDTVAAAVREKGLAFDNADPRPDNSEPVPSADSALDLKVAWVRGRLSAHQVVIVVDQFEELLSTDEASARQYAEDLHQWPTVHAHGSPHVRIVVVIRADLLPSLRRVWPITVGADATITVGPLTREQLLEAVVAPVMSTGFVAFEERLPERIVTDLGTQPYCLPALQVVLHELWERSITDGLLRHHVYQELNGRDGPLTSHLRETWHKLAQSTREHAKNLFLHLAVPVGRDGFVRRTAHQSEVGEDLWEIAGHLAFHRLVVLRGATQREATVELVHDALLEQWPTLADQLREHRDFLSKRDDLRRQLSAWRKTGQDSAHLLRGSALKEAISWLKASGAEISGGERGFVAASRDHQRRRRRSAALFGGSIVMIFALIAGVAVAQAMSAERTQGNADADRLAATAKELFTTRPDVAKQLAVAAYRRTPTPAAIGALVQSMAAPGVIDPPAPVRVLAFTGDGRSVLLGTTAKTFIWDLREHRITGSLSGWRGDVTALATTPDGRTVAVSSEEGDVRIWDISDRTRPFQVAQLAAVSPAATRLLFSPDGSRLVAALDPNRDWADPGQSAVRVWDVTQRHAPRPLVVLTSSVGREPTLSFGDAGRILAVGGTFTVLVDLSAPHAPHRLAKMATENGVLSSRSNLLIGRQGNTVQVWSVRDPNHPQLIGHASSEIPLKGKTVLSPDGQLGVIGSPAGVIDLSAPEDPVLFQACMGTGPSPDGTADDPPLALSPDGRTLASAGRSGIEIRNLAEPACSGAAGVLSGSGARAVAAIRTDGQFLAVSDTLSGLTTAYIGSGLTPRVLSRMPMTVSGTQNFTAAIAVSGDGRTLASSGSDDIVRLWQWTGTKVTKLAEIPGPATSVEALALDDLGTTLAAASTGLITLWNLDDPRNPQKMTINEQRTGAVQAVALDQRHHMLANAYDDAIQLWDISQPARPLLTKTLPGHAGGVNALRFAPPSRTLLSGGADGTVRIWDVTNPRSASLMTTLTGHTAPVTAVSLNDNARLVASGDETGVVRLWQRGPGRQAALIGTLGLKGGPSIASVDLTSDGRRLAVSDTNGQVLLWNVEPEAMIRIICAGVATPIAKADWNQLARGLEYRPPCAS